MKLPVEKDYDYSESFVKELLIKLLERLSNYFSSHAYYVYGHLFKRHIICTVSHMITKL